MSSLIHLLNIALVNLNLDLTIIFILLPFPGRGISRFLASIAAAETANLESKRLLPNAAKLK